MTKRDDLLIKIKDENDFPSVDTLLSHARSRHRVIVEMTFKVPYYDNVYPDPARETKKLLIDQLSPLLPDHAVAEVCFIDTPWYKDWQNRKAGQIHKYKSRLIIRSLATAAHIEAAFPQLIDATRDFRRIANELMTRQAAQLEVDPRSFLEPHGWAGKIEQTGQLDSEWRRFFHGYECGFENRKTGQSVEVRLGFQQADGSMEFGVLEGGFFCRFARTTGKYKDIDNLLRDDGLSADRAFDILGAQGHLQWLENETWRCSGWVAVD